jgi:Ca2+-binding RTX toxin-like protein
MVLGAWTNDNLSAVDATNFIAGKNVLVVGGMGNDTMTGGAANDTFTWFSGDAGTAGAVDVVKSFSTWNGTAGDKLNILKLLSGYTSGASTLSQWVTSVTTAQTSPAGVAGSTKIVIDVDGTGAGTVTQTIWLEGVNLPAIDPAVLKASGVLIA